MLSFPPESPGDCFTVGQLFSAKVFDHNYQFMISVIPIIIMIIIIKMMPLSQESDEDRVAGSRLFKTSTVGGKKVTFVVSSCR